MIQIVELTHDQKIKMYMKFSKKEIIELLINCNSVLDTFIKPNILTNPKKEQEYEPYFGWCDVDGCKNEGCSIGIIPYELYNTYIECLSKLGVTH